MIELLIDRRTHDLGGGFEVGRLLPYARRRSVGPFIFFDHMGPVDFAPGIPSSLDVRPHPHIGLSTVTYLFSGEIMHRDSLGSVAPIRPGEVNWMTAGQGITHSERFEKARLLGDRLHGIQAWVALPIEDEEMVPQFSHHAGTELPEWDDAGVRGRLVAGEAYGLKAQVPTRSPLYYVHLELATGARFGLAAEHKEHAVYVAAGEVELAGGRVTRGQMATVTGGNAAQQSAGAVQYALRALRTSTVMLLGGEPLGERHLYWNFASSRRERLEQAVADWRAGRMRLPIGDDREFIPLPAA